MTQFRVKEAAQTSTKTTDYGEKQVIALVLQEYGVQETVAAEWFTNATTPLPAPGSTVEGECSPSQYGMKFRKTQAGGGGFRPGGGRSPEDTKQIVRQHSQEMAIRYLNVQVALGKVPDGFRIGDLTRIVDWFQHDAETGWKTSPPAPEPLPPAEHATDIPDPGPEQPELAGVDTDAVPF